MANSNLSNSHCLSGKGLNLVKIFDYVIQTQHIDTRVGFRPNILANLVSKHHWDVPCWLVIDKVPVQGFVFVPKRE